MMIMWIKFDGENTVKIRYILVAIFLFAAYAYVSNDDYNSAQLEHQHACEMVKAGAWPASFCRN